MEDGQKKEELLESYAFDIAFLVEPCQINVSLNQSGVRLELEFKII